MNNEEFQKILEFLAKPQENFAENMEQAEARMSRLERAFVSLFALTGENTKAIKEMIEKIKELV